MKNLYINEPAPWEQKAAYYSQVKMEKDIEKQTNVISHATRDMIATQMIATNDIIASQDRIAEGIDRVGYAVQDINNGLASLAAAFEWGISQVIWNLEQNREILKNIVEILSAPLDTQSKELKKRADIAYSNEWFDDAIVDYQAAEEKNKYDFTIHISMGMIYLFNIINKEKALECFDKAIKYARPKSNYHTSLALLYKSLCLRDIGKIKEALQCAEEAYELTKEMIEARYQCALYQTLLQYAPEQIASCFVTTLDHDKHYALKANNEPAFDNIRADINDCIVRVMKSNYAEVKSTLPNMNKLYEKWKSFIENMQSNLPSINMDKFNVMGVIIDRIKLLIERNSFFDSVEAKEKILLLSFADEIIRDDLKKQLQGLLGKYRSDLNSEMNILRENIKQKNEKTISRARVASVFFIIVTIFSFIACGVYEAVKRYGENNYFSIGFIIGVLGIVCSLLAKGMANDSHIKVKTPKVLELETKIEKATVYLNSL